MNLLRTNILKFTLVIFSLLVISYLLLFIIGQVLIPSFTSTEQNISISPVPSVTIQPTPTEVILPSRKTLSNSYHVFQTFNNCGPASLSMALSYYGINLSQNELGESLRPYQVPDGDNDDKSVTLEELAKKSEELGLYAYHRPTGNIKILKKFISMGFPIITRTLLKENDDIGHFRVVKGYDDTTSSILQDDSYDGKNIWYTYDYFDTIWKKFGYEYLVIAPPDRKQDVENILGEDLNMQIAWQKAADLFTNQALQNPSDYFPKFNLSVALFHLKRYEESIRYFEEVENQLPFRTLWYQIEPIESYYQTGNYARVFEITDKILNGGNRAFSELYYLRGLSFNNQNTILQAKEEFKKALYYNRNYQPAQEKLNSLES